MILESSQPEVSKNVYGCLCVSKKNFFCASTQGDEVGRTLAEHVYSRTPLTMNE